MEVWNWKENVCLGELGTSLRYGVDQLGAPCFPEPNLLCYCENAGVRSILLDCDAPDAQTVAALQELACYELCDDQSLRSKTPQYPGQLGNWEAILHPVSPLNRSE